MRIVEETILVKGATTIDFPVRLTRHGAIIDDISRHTPRPGYAVAMRWSQADFPLVMKGFWLVNRATNIEEVETAAGYAKSGQNWIYADDRGNIGFYFLGGIPRRVGFSGELPVPGWESAFEWQDYVPNREQPHLRNPAQGYIVNANNKVGPEGYPHIISKYYATPDRYIRIAEMIEEKETLSSREFEIMQADQVMVTASFRDAVAYLTEALGSDVSAWQWGQLHTLTIHHPFGLKSALLGKVFDLGSFPADGSLFTVNPTYFKVSQSYEAQGGGASAWESSGEFFLV